MIMTNMVACTDVAARSVEQIGEAVIQQLRIANCHAKSFTQAAVKIGELLTAAKAQLKHGDFIPWLDEHCSLQLRTAQGYMRLAERLRQMSFEDAQRVAHLSVREAIKCMAGPSQERLAHTRIAPSKTMDAGPLTDLQIICTAFRK